jgi:outer membrane receptor protein involved in Fe transport
MTLNRVGQASNFRSVGWILLLLGALCFLLPGTAHAQAQAAVNGTVHDTSGAIIPDASVTLHNNGTNLDRPASTNSVGAYVLTDIQPGNYDLRVSKDGFTTSVQSDINLVVNQTATYDFTLKTGSVKETVTVQATAAALETSTSELGVAIVRKEVNDLPLNGRNFTQLLALTPGVVTINVSQNGSTGGVWSNPIGSFTYPSVNGQTNRSNLFLLDGVNNQGSFGSTYAVAPIVDDIQEFKVQSHNDDASFGGSLGGLINVVTKSGASQYHGSGWEFYRGASLDARPTFLPGGKPYSFTQNQFGGAGGGPIEIPGHSSGAPKTFFYAAYEGFRNSSIASTIYTTPTSDELAGNFSAFSGQIFNPYSVVPAPATPTGFMNMPFLCTGGVPSHVNPNKTQSSGVPCNMIPASTTDPTQNLLDPNMILYAKTIFPSPNLTGNLNGNGIDTSPTSVRQDTGTLRIDHQFSPQDNLWARYVGFWQPVSGSGGFLGLPHVQKTDGFNVGFGYSHAFSSSSLLDLTFGRVVLTINQGSNPTGAPASFGSTVFNPNFAGNFRGGVQMVPIVAIIGDIGNSNASAHNAAQVDYTRASNIWQYGGNYTKVYRRHTFRMGLNFETNNANALYLNSAVDFQAANTGDASTATGGNAIASFVLGVPFQATRRNVLETEHGGWVDGVYFMDSWRASEKLTVNLGLRYDLTLMPIYGDDHHANNFVGDLDAKTGIYYIQRDAPACNPPAVAAPCIPGGTLPGNVSVTPLANRAIYHNDFTNFQPRVGLAYQWRQSTVIRAGYGRFYDNWAAITQTAQNYEGTWPSLDQLSANVNRTTTVPTVVASDPLSQGASIPVTTGTPFTQTTWFADPYLKRPYADQWNVGVQQQLGSRTILNANYVGSRGNKLDLGPYANTINPALINPITGLPGAQPLTFRDPGNNFAVTPVTPTPFDYSGGSSKYNALQVSLDGRSWHGLTYLISYTWSKSTDVGCTGWYGVEGCGIQNPYDVRADKGNSAIDIPQIFSGAWVYELPFGSNKKWSSGNKAVDYIIGGWNLNGIVSLTSGQPFDIGLGGDPAQTLNFGCCNGYYERLDTVKGEPQYAPNKGPGAWLNVQSVTDPKTKVTTCTGAFTCSFGKFQFGDLKRNSLRSDWFKNVDLSLFKQFPINERFRAEFRFEAFNLSNTPTWNIPDRQVTDTHFNQVLSTLSVARQLQLGVKLYF